KTVEGFQTSRVIAKDDISFVHVNTPKGLTILYPVLGHEKNGYFSSKQEVQDLYFHVTAIQRDELYRDSNKVFPFLLSLGFSLSAQNVAQQTPKIALLPIWAFIKLIEYLTGKASQLSSVRSIVKIYQ